MTSERTNLVASGGRAPERWLMLLLFSLVAASNAYMFMSLAAIEPEAEKFYSADALVINGVGQALYAGYIVVAPVALVLSTRLGLRNTLVAASALNAVGACMRAVPTSSLAWLFAGSAVAGIGLSLLLGVPPWLSAAWFHESERTTATAIGTQATQLGLWLAYVSLPSFVSDDGKQIPAMHIGIACCCLAFAAAIAVLFRGRPGRAAAAACDSTTSTDGVVGSGEASPPSATVLRVVLCSGRLQALAIIFSCSTGIYWTLALVLAEALDGQGYSDGEVGMLGGLYLGGGLISMVAAGLLLDRCFHAPPYKAFVCGCLLLSTAVLGFFAWAISQRNALAAVTPAALVLGLVLPAIQPAGLELAVLYSSQEVPEEVSGSYLYLVAMVTGLLLPFLADGIGTTRAAACFTGALAVATGGACLLPSEPGRKRTQPQTAEGEASAPSATPG